MASYANLSRAQLTYEYLHTNSTTHEFLFGALAELVDNSHDANATEMHINAVPAEKFRGSFYLCFLDNGCGMDPDEVSQVIQFGRSSKRDAGANHIGQYGNGLKSGSMRIGKDMMLFTKKGATMSCLFLSRTFHEKEDILEVIVPIPSWHSKDRKPYLNEQHGAERHKIEMEIITKYSPFESEEEVLAQFDKISGESGTIVIVFNLKLLDNGDPELTVKEEERDIVMADPYATEVYDTDENVLPQRVSFRAYTSVLYYDPRMKIYIQGKKVRTIRLVNSLYMPRNYMYTSNRFKTRSEQEAEKAERIAKLAEEKARELATQAREIHQKHSTLSKADRDVVELAVAKADEAKFDADIKRRMAQAKRKSAKEAKTLTFTFGLQVEKRRLDGLFVYNCNRLIKMYERTGPQLEGGVKCAGVVGVVDVPYLVLEPTHNKQDFADHKEYKHLLKSMSDHLLQYWKDSKIEATGITKFWDEFGYTGQWKDDPSDEQKYKLKRLMSVPMWLQCDKCLKWRQLQFSRKMVAYEVPSDWVCQMNPDTSFQSCSKPEQKAQITVGKLLKDTRNLDDKREEEVRKLQEKLEQKQAVMKKSKKSSPEKARSPSPPRTKRAQRSPSPATSSKDSLADSPTLQRKQPKRRKSASPPPKTSRSANQTHSSKSPLNSRASPPPSPKHAGKLTPSSVDVSPSKPSTRQSTLSLPPAKAIKERISARGLLGSNSASEKPFKRKQSESSDVSTLAGTSDDKRKLKQELADVSEPSTKRVKGSASSILANDSLSESTDEIEEVTASELYPLHAKVEVKMHNSWYAGSVVAFKKSSEGSVRVRVKFEKHSHDKFDKWFVESDPTLRLREDTADATSNINGDAFLVSDSSTPAGASEISSRGTNETYYSTMTDSLDVKGELLEKVTHLLRRCLCYFRAPDFEKEKKEILNLTPQELRDFPIGTFFDDYERNIKKQLQATRDNLSRRTDEAEKKFKDADSEKKKLDKEVKDLRQQVSKQAKTLKELRQGVNVMLRSILNEDEKLEANDTSENVDIYLKTIVEQINETSG